MYFRHVFTDKLLLKLSQRRVLRCGYCRQQLKEMLEETISRAVVEACSIVDAAHFQFAGQRNEQCNRMAGLGPYRAYRGDFELERRRIKNREIDGIIFNDQYAFIERQRARHLTPLVNLSR